MIRFSRRTALASVLAVGAMILAPAASHASLVTLDVSNGSFASTAGNVTVNNGFSATQSGILVNASSGSTDGGPLSLIFETGQPAATPDLDRTFDTPVSVDLGTFTINVPSGTGASDYAIANGTTTFTVTVNQTYPVNGSQVLTTGLSGTVTRIPPGIIGGSYSLGFSFAETSFKLGGNIYTLKNLTGGNTLVLNAGNSSKAGVTSLSASITAAVPEPATTTLALSGLGVVGLAGLRRLRRLRRRS